MTFRKASVLFFLIIRSLAHQILLEALIELMSSIISHQLLPVIGRGGLTDDRNIPPGPDRHPMAGDLRSQILGIGVLHSQPVKLSVFVPLLEMDLQIDALALPHAGRGLFRSGSPHSPCVSPRRHPRPDDVPS